MRSRLFRLLAVLALGALLGGCGRASLGSAGAVGAPTTAPGAVSVTKNTTRLGGALAALDAAAVARAVYPGLTPATRPQAVVLVDQRDWAAALTASALASAPLSAPLLYSDGDTLPAASAQALRAMHPLGAAALDGAQVIRIGTRAAVPAGYSTQTVSTAGGAAATAVALEQILSATQHATPREVIVLAADAPPALQMPAAALSAESGAPILLVTAATVPSATATVLAGLHRPAIYAVGASAIAARPLSELARYGRLVRIAGDAATSQRPGPNERGSAVENAIAVARFADGSFGWGIHEAGHGLVFANASRPLDAPATAPLAASGDYGPLLLLESSASLPTGLVHYLSAIEPGYTRAIPPVRGVYNHGWLIGDESAISAMAQAEIDAVLQIAPRTESSVQASAPAIE
jgi:hypothetical protein